MSDQASRPNISRTRTGYGQPAALSGSREECIDAVIFREVLEAADCMSMDTLKDGLFHGGKETRVLIFSYPMWFFLIYCF